MNKAAVKAKIKSLEANLQLLKISVQKEPDFAVDEKNWKKIKPNLKKARVKTYKEVYG